MKLGHQGVYEYRNIKQNVVEAELNKNSISFVYFMKNVYIKIHFMTKSEIWPIYWSVFLFNITQRAKSPRVPRMLNLNGGLMRNSYQVS